MRTTIELPDQLFRQLKTLSAAKGQTLKQFYTEAMIRAVEEAAVVEPRRMNRPPIRREGGSVIPARSNEELFGLLEADDSPEAP